MHTLQIILSALILMVLFGLINLMMNYISRRDGEPIVPFRKKLWLIPLLSAFIIIPLELFAMLYARWFPISEPSGPGEILAYDGQGVWLSFSLTILIGFLIFEGILHPLIITLLRLLLRKDTSIYIKQAVTVVTDTVLLYIAFLIMPGIPVGGWLQALLIAVFFHLIEWILIGVQTWVQQRKRARTESAG
ncbi:hypothetical protein AB4124_13065 [Paenibacillus sp. 2KB_20]|uniref:hypothetical protein n=1 Tax=Paenibacillus sp. 2KB_20 TaxID=3232977 RepID=UPI003F9494DA